MQQLRNHFRDGCSQCIGNIMAAVNVSDGRIPASLPFAVDAVESNKLKDLEETSISLIK